jgi:gas vesicle protein
MQNYENSGTGSSMNFLFGIIVGAVAGAGIALLFAPKSGAELRSDLGNQMHSLKDSAAKRFRDMKDRANAGINDLQTAATRATDRPV